MARRCLRLDRCELSRWCGPAGIIELARGVERLRCRRRHRRRADIVTATRVVVAFIARAFVKAACAGGTRGCTGTVAFTTAVTTTTTTTSTAPRPASGALAAIALGTLLLAIALLRRCAGGIDHVHFARHRCDDRSGGGDLLARFLWFAILTGRSRFARFAGLARLARRARLLRLALALLAAVAPRLALARSTFATLALTLATITTSATRSLVTTRLLLGLRTVRLVAPGFGAATRLARSTLGTVLAPRFVARATFAAAFAATTAIPAVAATIAATAAFIAIAVMTRSITLDFLAAASAARGRRRLRLGRALVAGEPAPHPHQHVVARSEDRCGNDHRGSRDGDRGGPRPREPRAGQECSG